MADCRQRPGLGAVRPARETGCFLFQLPPSYRYTRARLDAIVSQLDPARRNVVEFRHASWWNEDVYSAFHKAGIIFCSCSGPRLPDELIRTAAEVYVRLHGPERWYHHDYSDDELLEWANKIRASGAKRAWIYFNNDDDAYAPKNALALRRLLAGFGRGTAKKESAGRPPRISLAAGNSVVREILDTDCNSE